MCEDTGMPLYGHSLSWSDEKQERTGPGSTNSNRYVAKVWVPQPDTSPFLSPDTDLSF